MLFSFLLHRWYHSPTDLLELMESNIEKILLFLITTPTYLMVLDAAKPQKPSSSADLTYPIMLCAFVCLEFYADQQQWGKPEIIS